MDKPFAQSCENNKQPIVDVLKRVFVDRQKVLEIGSGTGQHAVYFAEQLPHLVWQTSDLPENHPGIHCWINDANLPNVIPPLAINAKTQPWPIDSVDAVFTANTMHIMSWQEVQQFFSGLEKVLDDNGKLAIYGPFNYNGQFTSDSNAQFNEWLKSQAAHRAIRDFEKINALAEAIGLRLLEDNSMPANNRLLVWQL